MSETPDVRTMSDAELTDLLAVVSYELDRRRTVVETTDRVGDLISRYEQAVVSKPAVEWEPGKVIGPGERVIEGGVEWVNKARAWLSAPPSLYPMGYQRTVPPQNVTPFVAGQNVAVGNLRRFQGGIYQCLQAHTTSTEWTPDVAVSLWTYISVAPETGPEPEPEPPAAAPAWASGVAYTVGQLVTYNGKTYRIGQPHTSAGHWLPPDLPALYTPVNP